MSALYSVTDLIAESNTLWFPTAEGFDVELPWSLGRGRHHVTHDELASVHPDLPQGILLLRAVKYPENDTRGLTVAGLLEFWASPCIVEDTKKGRVRLLNTRHANAKTKFVYFSGSSAREFVTSVPSASGEAIRIPLMRPADKVQVACEWMDDNYPGWEQRFAVARALYDDTAAAVLHMFDMSTPAEHVALPLDFV